jgi:sigma54-dependent transcription regulator
MKNIVVIGFVGAQLDSGKSPGRWEKWRPTVALTQREELLIQRIELLCTAQHQALAEQVAADIALSSPETQVRPTTLEIADPWDFGDVYAALFDFAAAYPFNAEEEEYWIHITTGTHVAQICLFLMAEARYFPGLLLQTSPPKRQAAGEPCGYALIDLDLSKYKEARRNYLDFAMSPAARWSGNFRDLGASVMRMATLAEGGRIADHLVDAEIARLRAQWAPSDEPEATGLERLLPAEEWAKIDLFDRLQLEAVIRVCRESASLSDAGRRLFAVSLSKRAAANDADRLRKYLARFGLDWKRIKAEEGGAAILVLAGSARRERSQARL